MSKKTLKVHNLNHGSKIKESEIELTPEQIEKLRKKLEENILKLKEEKDGKGNN